MKLYDRTEQQIFDEAIAHARKQGRKSVNRIGGCRYRSEDGLKCFIGALISDEDYSPKLESRTVWHLTENAVGIPEGKKQGLAAELQILHDQSSPKDWEAGFEDIAKRFGLIYTPPQEIGNEAI